MAIPVEIFYSVLDELITHYRQSDGTRSDVLSCSQVSHTFRSYLLPTLFRDAPCWSSKCIQTLYDLLVANPRVATYIRTLALVRGGKGSKWSRDINWVAKDASIQLVVNILASSIEEFTLETSAECGHLAWAGIRPHVRASLRLLVSSPSLKTLVIKQFEVSRDVIELISPSVEHLTLEGVRLAYSGGDVNSPHHSTSNLQTLTLWHSPLPLELLVHSFHNNGFPSLHTIGVKDRGLLDGDLRGATRLIPLAPNLRVLKTDSKIFFKDSPVRVKSIARTSPFTSLVLSCPYDPSFPVMINTINRWLSASLDMDELPPPPHAVITPPGSPPIPSVVPSSFTGFTSPAATPSVNILSYPPRSTLKTLSFEFASANSHLTKRDTTTKLCGQVNGVEEDLKTLKSLLNHPEYEAVPKVKLDFRSFGLTEDQGRSLERFILGHLEEEDRADNSARSHSPRFTLAY